MIDPFRGYSMSVITKPRPRRSLARRLSALRLRAALAVFGLWACGILAVLAQRAQLTWLAIVLGALAVTALVDLYVIGHRWAHQRKRRRASGVGGT